MAVYAPDQMRLSITTSSDGFVEFVQIRGDVDLSDSAELAVASQTLLRSSATTVYVDLGGTTFMGSTLIAFLVKIAGNGPARRAMILCRPSATARRVIQMTDLDQIAELVAELPSVWPDDAGAPDLTSDESKERPESS